MEKRMEKGKNIMIMVIYYMMENMKMANGMEKEKSIIEMVK